MRHPIFWFKRLMSFSVKRASKNRRRGSATKAAHTFCTWTLVNIVIYLIFCDSFTCPVGWCKRTLARNASFGQSCHPICTTQGPRVGSQNKVPSHGRGRLGPRDAFLERLNYDDEDKSRLHTYRKIKWFFTFDFNTDYKRNL